MDHITGIEIFNPSLGFAESAPLRMALAQPMVGMLNAQANLLSTFNTSAERWINRRREDAEAARDTLDRMAGCRDLTDFMGIYGDWVQGNMQRMSDDLAALGEQAQALYACGMAGAQRVEEQAKQAAEQMPQAIAA